MDAEGVFFSQVLQGSNAGPKELKHALVEISIVLYIRGIVLIIIQAPTLLLGSRLRHWA